MRTRALLGILLSLAVVWPAVAGEEDNPPQPKPEEGRGKEKKRPGAAGQADEGRPQRPRGDMLRGRGGRGPFMDMQANMLQGFGRMLGYDFEVHDKAPRLDALPVGASRRFIFNVPVGGVDTPGSTGAGWKVEALFTLTEDQQKAVKALREEYEAERAKFELEVAQQQKALADKLVQMRQKFEQRANEVLAGADKEAKAKLDELGQDTCAKMNQVVADALKLYDLEDFTQGMALMRAVREKANDAIVAAEDGLLKLIPADARERIQEVLRNNAAARQEMNGFMQFGPGNRRVGPQGGEAPAVPPPAPPGGEGF